MLKLILSPSIVCLVSIYFIFSFGQQVKADDLNYPENKLTSPIIAQNQKPRLKFKLPDRGVPNARIGGATRSLTKPVVAIIPSEKIALTNSESPTIFVYISKNEAISGSVKISNESGKELYSSEFKLPEKTGILRIKLPKTLNLETNKLYKWEVKLNFKDNNPIVASKYRTFGWLEKVSLKEDVSTKETWANLNVLAEAGIWYDTLEQLAILRLENPEDKDIQVEWTELLKSVGLNNVADSDILSEVVIIN
ncbi:DUF928 domain-containing protein [Geminocystis sp. GBBB08]|uniref:DUF928 domain-containing protein n=1 Tax=Geminocystis sp. GBBB08 TaxID=2604140 RepID=UPI0027E230A2|nr:DUF928 domain-containing protein [Geminocystis sp. GBBB08]MBL1208462.1 DUF928 domain-containing protein [Geminocystis sp. GBBB08]